MSAESVVVTELQGHVLSIRINRPDKKNAINIATYRALSEAFRRGHSDAAVRAVLISGTADCFSSGNDMSDFLNTPADIASSSIGEFMMSLLECGKPVVAAVNGPAIGIGVTMLMHCDLVYAGEKARLQMPFVNIGICPEFGSSLIAPAIMGHARAAELILLGEAFTAAKAREYGLVNEVLPDAEVLARAQERAAKLAAQPPNAMRTTKQLMKRWTLEQLRLVVGVENGTFVPMLKMPEAIEAISAFQQKRKPDFSKFA